jgi:hypothetical protein
VDYKATSYDRHQSRGFGRATDHISDVKRDRSLTKLCEIRSSAKIHTVHVYEYN